MSDNLNLNQNATKISSFEFDFYRGGGLQGSLMLYSPETEVFNGGSLLFPFLPFKGAVHEKIKISQLSPGIPRYSVSNKGVLGNHSRNYGSIFKFFVPFINRFIFLIE